MGLKAIIDVTGISPSSILLFLNCIVIGNADHLDWIGMVLAYRDYRTGEFVPKNKPYLPKGVILYNYGPDSGTISNMFL